MTSLRTWCRFAGIYALEDYIGPQPLRTMPHPLPGGIDDVYRMINCASSPQQRALVTQCGLMGMRIFEALKATTTEYDLREMTCTIRGKRDKVRIIPVSTIAWDSLQTAYMQSFVDGGGRIVRVEDRYARELITKLGKRAGIKRRVSSHDLRQTFATHVYATTNDIRLVQELLGHDSIKTTQLYTDVFMSTARAALEFDRSGER